jgi:hypothetical protein
MEIRGSHKAFGKFTATFADGHSSTVTCHMTGTMASPQMFMSQSPWWKGYWRAPEWRYDNFPSGQLGRSWYDWGTALTDHLLTGFGY